MIQIGESCVGRFGDSAKTGYKWLKRLGHNACQQSYSVRYYRISKLMLALTQAKADGSYHKQLKQLAKCQLLIVDDWGLEPLEPAQRNDLMEISETEKEVDHGKQELAQCMAPLLATLPETYRQAIQLSELDGAKQKDVATQLEITLSGSKSRIQLGRKLLRNYRLLVLRNESIFLFKKTEQIRYLKGIDLSGSWRCLRGR
jgi:DNA-directed RNA polymerase specialized sigma24 family protein